MNKKKIFFKTIKLFKIGLIAGVSFFVIERFCHKYTRGFATSRITDLSSFCYSADFFPLPDQDFLAVLPLLDQPFHFLGSGGQFFAFESSDHQTVIKFFKFHHLNYPKVLDVLPVPSFVTHWKKQRKRKKENLFKSCALALEELKEETGLLYLQLGPTTCLKKTLILIDNLGITHQIDLTKTAFVLQKKADLFFPHLMHLISLNQWENTKQSIRSLMQFFVFLNQKGIRDKDRGLKRNVGFIHDTAAIIDIGSFEKKGPVQDPLKFKKDLLAKTDKLRAWIKKFHPNLMPYYEEQIEEFTKTL